MKTLLLFLTSLVIVTANAQLSLSFKAGTNNTTVHMAHKPGWVQTKSRFGWQGGVQANNEWKHWIIYSGLNLAQNSFFVKTGDNSYIKSPIFLNMPLGAGYKFYLKPRMSLRFYGGLFGNIGIGGTVKEKIVIFCDPMACPEQAPVTENDPGRKIHYGNNYNGYPASDVRKTNWGLQFGSGVKIHAVECMLMYNLGLSVAVPYYTADDKKRLRYIDLTVKVDLRTFKHK